MAQRLNLEEVSPTLTWHRWDAIYKVPQHGGTIYVGDEWTSKDSKLLQSLHINRIVNCTQGDSRIPNYHSSDPRFEYLNFEVCYWENSVGSSDESVLAYFEPLWNFMDQSLFVGQSVLIHCLAGAHRAGTVGIASLIHYAGIIYTQRNLIFLFHVLLYFRTSH